MSPALPTPKTMTLALDQICAETPGISRKDARKIVVERWPGLKSIPRVEVIRQKTAAATAAQPKAPSPADLVALARERDDLREQNAVLEAALADRNGEIVALKEDLARAQAELEELVLDDGDDTPGAPAQLKSKPPKGGQGTSANPADPLALTHPTP